MTLMVIIAQIVRAVASIFSIIADRSNNRKHTLIFNAIFNLLNGVQYLLLDALTGAISSFITVLRNLVFYVSKKRVPVIVLLFYFVVVFLVNLGSIDSPIAAIPILLVIIYSTGIYVNNVLVFKICVLLTCLLEIVYDLNVDAYVGVVVCVVDIIFVLFSMRTMKKRPGKRGIIKT